MLDIRTKASLLALFAAFLFGWLSLHLFSPPTALPATADTTVFSAERAMQHLKIIAKEPHSVGTPANDQVTDYLVKELEKLGLSVSIQDTLVSRTDERRRATRISRVKNIVGVLKGQNSSKAVMLMAHHDSQPNTPGAADDGSGVVAILESVSALKASEPLQNDLIVLITDAEEIGLMGAKAFVDYHPLLPEIGVILNLEARGNRGVSMSFEMNPENGWIAQEFANAAPYPFANSMAYEIYKIMPNDTDFSVFREADVAGVNAATVEGFVHYHSMTDTPENISPDLVQHHGSNMLGMLRHFGNIDLSQTKAPDAVFFNPIGSKIIIYPASYNLFFILLTVALFGAVVFLGTKRQQVYLSHVFVGTGYFLVVLAVVGILSLLLQQVILALHPHYTLFYANNFYNVEYYFFAFLGIAFLCYALIFGFQTKYNGLSLSLGGVLMLVMAMFGLTLSLPTGTYLLYYPLLFFLLGQLILLIFNITVGNKPVAFAMGQFLSLLPLIALWTPTIYLLFETFGLTQAVVAPVVLACFFGVLLIPLLHPISRWKKSVPLIFGGCLLLAGMIGGALTADYDEVNPLQIYLMYGLDKDSETSVWATNKRYKNQWIKSLIPTEEPQAFEQIYPGWNWQLWQAPAPKLDLATSEISVLSDTTNEAGLRTLECQVQFTDFVNSMEFFVENGAAVNAIKINDLEIPSTIKEREKALYFNFFAPPMEGFRLTIQTKNEEQKLRLVNRTIGLPANLYKTPMPKNMIHGPGDRSNVTLVKKTYAF